MSSNTPYQEPKKNGNNQPTRDNSNGEKGRGNWFNYAANNTRDIIAYIILVIGIIMLFFQPLYGGLLIGLVAGIYFSKEIIRIIKNCESMVEEEGVVRSIILCGVALAFFISAPAIFIGAAIIVALKLFLASDSNKDL